MKHKLCVLLCFMGVVHMAYCQDYYWYEGQKIYLTPGDEKYVL